MYKIYINSTLIKLKDAKPVKEAKDTELVARYSGSVKHLHNFIDLAEKGSQYRKIVIYSEDYQKLKSDFKGIFTIIKAAGGIVRNEFEELLFIFRRGHWDLPKGKLEQGESLENAAVREVEEETGIKDIVLGKKICVTNHVYKNKSGKRMIKKSYWYHMSAPKIPLVPQTEEDITKAEWMTLDKFDKEDRVVYNSIIKVINKYKKSINPSIESILDKANLQLDV